MALMVATLSVGSFFLIGLTPGPAFADCGLLSTSCIVGAVEDTTSGAVDTVGQTVDQTADQVDETVDQVVNVVENVGGTVKETADKVVETVKNTVDDTQETIDDTVAAIDDTVRGVDPVAPPPPSGASEQGSIDPSASGSHPDAKNSVLRPQGRRRSAPTLKGVELVAGTLPAGDAAITGTSPTSPVDELGPFAGSLPQIARTLAFPLVLVGLVLGFVAIQNRLDRKDPKLALATTTPDVLAFR
jgi:hypothetical protein